MDVKPSLIFGEKVSQHLWILSADVVVVLGEISQAPRTQLLGIMQLK